jgi:hypothetical protein
MNKSNDAGQNINFDGGNDGVTVADSASIRDLATITYSAWVNQTANGVSSRIIDKVYKQFLSGDGTVSFNHNFSGTQGSWYKSSAFSMGAWHHVTVTYDNSNVANVPILYVDGVKQTWTGLTQPTGTATLDTGSSIYIGNNNTYTRGLQGKIDGPRIYNRILTGSEIATIYNGGLGSNTNSSSGIVGWWKMNEGSGITAADSSGSNNPGTLTNGPTWSTGSPVKEQSALWVGTNGAGANDGAVTAISLATQRQITSYTTANSSLPDNDVTSLSLGTGGLALVGTEAGAWPAGMAGIPVDDTAATPAGAQPTSDRLKSGTIRFKSGTIRLK